MKGSQVLRLKVYTTTPDYQLYLNSSSILTSTQPHSVMLGPPIFPAHTLQLHNSPQAHSTQSSHPVPGFPTHIPPLHAPLPVCFTHRDPQSSRQPSQSRPQTPTHTAPQLPQSLTLNFVVTPPLFSQYSSVISITPPRIPPTSPP